MGLHGLIFGISQLSQLSFFLIFLMLHICAQIKRGMLNSRSMDANRLKTHTANYAPLDPENERVVLCTGRSKMDRGFNHPVLGRLLLPVDLLGEYDRNHNEYVIHLKF